MISTKKSSFCKWPIAIVATSFSSEIPIQVLNILLVQYFICYICRPFCSLGTIIANSQEELWKGCWYCVQVLRGQGGLPYKSNIGMCHPKGYRFWAVLVWKRVQILPILVLNRVWSKELRLCMNVFSFQFQINKKPSVINEFKMDFKESFCWRSYLSNDDIISVLCKRVSLMASSRSESGCGKQVTFFGLK